MVQTAHADVSLDPGLADPHRDLAGPAPRAIPSNHAPSHAPAMTPMLGLGVTALVTAARTWLPPD